MKHLLIGTLTILTAVAADSTITNGRPDLRGLWQAHNPADPKTIMAYYTVSQSGNGFTMTYLPAGKPEIVMFEGSFESNALVAGKAQGDTLRWTPAKIGVPDANHLKLEDGPMLIRATPSEAAIFKQLRRFSFTKIPEKPFNLAGTWSLTNGRKAWISQNGDQFSMGLDGSQTPFFRGRYVSNPVIKGEALEREANTPKWVEQSIAVQDPDHLKSDGVTLFRVSKPASQDIACDEQNANHVKDYYAWVRGAMASSQKDYKTARCWLTIGADWEFPAAQSMLAALIVKGTYGTARLSARVQTRHQKRGAGGHRRGGSAREPVPRRKRDAARSPESRVLASQGGSDPSQREVEDVDSEDGLGPQRLGRGRPGFGLFPGSRCRYERRDGRGSVLRGAV